MEHLMLSYDAEYAIWRCEGLWMSDATFKRYVEAWLESRGIKNPTMEQLRAAAQHCSHVEYWQGCIDEAVHFTPARASRPAWLVQLCYL
jgi:hypothetical protein